MSTLVEGINKADVAKAKPALKAKGRSMMAESAGLGRETKAGMKKSQISEKREQLQIEMKWMEGMEVRGQTEWRGNNVSRLLAESG